MDDRSTYYLCLLLFVAARKRETDQVDLLLHGTMVSKNEPTTTRIIDRSIDRKAWRWRELRADMEGWSEASERRGASLASYASISMDAWDGMSPSASVVHAIACRCRNIIVHAFPLPCMHADERSLSIELLMDTTHGPRPLLLPLPPRSHASSNHPRPLRRTCMRA
jgi:hypothetical protein